MIHEHQKSVHGYKLLNGILAVEGFQVYACVLLIVNTNRHEIIPSMGSVVFRQRISRA